MLVLYVESALASRVAVGRRRWLRLTSRQSVGVNMSPMRKSGVPTAAIVVAVAALAGGLLGQGVGALGLADRGDSDRVSERYRMFTAALARWSMNTSWNWTPRNWSTAPLTGCCGPWIHTPTSSIRRHARRCASARRASTTALSIVTVNDDITVVNLFEGTPAYRAGIRRGDVIAIVKGKSAKGGPPSRPSRNCEAPRARKSRFRFAGSIS